MSFKEVFGVPHLSMRIDKSIYCLKYRISLMDLKHDEMLDCIEISNYDIVKSKKTPMIFISQRMASYEQELIREFGI